VNAVETTLADLLVLALMTELAANFLRNFVPAAKGSVPLVTGALAALLCLFTSTGLVAAAGLSLPEWLDYVLTGAVVTRLADLVHGLAKKLA
jgi:hypothetical protein